MRAIGRVVFWLVAVKLMVIAAVLGFSAMVALGEFHRDATIPTAFAVFVFVMGIWCAVLPLNRRLFSRP